MAPVEREINTNEKFLAHIAHDLKTPIKAQARAIELLFSGALGNLNENVQNMLINMNASNKYMQCLIDNILTDYRLNNFNFVLNKTDNDIRKTIEESVKNVEILFVSKKQRIVLNYFANSFIKNYDDIQIQRVIVCFLTFMNIQKKIQRLS